MNSLPWATRLNAPSITALLAVVLAACAHSPEPPEERPVTTRTLQRRAPQPVARAVVPEPNPLLDTLPSRTRQTAEGYWMSPMIGPEHVAGIEAAGIRVVLSAVEPREGTIEALALAGISHHSVPMGGSFRHAETILAVTEPYPPGEVLIHCRHGADRTGSITAFLLVVRHGWAIEDALYSVVYPTRSDTNGLASVLRRFGMRDRRSPDDASVGFYSVTATGEGSGGLKARSDRYRRLVRTVIEAMQRHRS